MIFGLSIADFTTLHVILSLIGIVTGVIVLLAMLFGRHLRILAFVFLLTTLLTSATGFLFPFQSISPAQIVGAISLAALVIALLGLYAFGLSGSWRWVYVATAVFALYLNVFVGVVQAFQKIAPVHALAPTQTEPPFLIAQATVALLFLVLGGVAVRRFHR